MNMLRLTVLILFLLGSSGCDKAASPTQQDARETVAVTDFSNALVTLETPAKSIVALAPHIVENVFSAGAGDFLKGVIEYSNFPQEANDLPIIGSYERINYEEILRINPDLVIAWQSGGSHSLIQKLKELGFTVYIDQPKRLQDIAKSIRDIGILTANQTIAEPAASSFLKEIEKIAMQNKDKSQVTAFYQVWNAPLQTINGSHLISSAINICGGSNIYGDEFAVAPIVNVESVLERNPDTIIASGESDNESALLEDWLKWPSLSAVKNNHLFYINPDHLQRHSLRILIGIEGICAHFDQVRDSQV